MSREGRARWGFNQRFVIGRQGNPMMERWRLIQTPWFGAYVHFVYREDLDPHPHDHPWRFIRMVLRGGYTEEYAGQKIGAVGTLRPFRPGYFPTHARHRIVSVLPNTVSLVLVGRKRRTWGFWVPGVLGGMYVEEFVDYRDALGLRPNEGVQGDGVRSTESDGATS